MAETGSTDPRAARKRCGTCGVEKALSDDGYCQGRRYLSVHPCVDCGVSALRVLDFDHRPGTDKRDGVMQLVRNGFSLGVISTEIEKCDVRCRNCHAVVTYERMGTTWRSVATSRPATGSGHDFLP